MHVKNVILKVLNNEQRAISFKSFQQVEQKLHVQQKANRNIFKYCSLNLQSPLCLAMEL
jgi:hypothetical protein